MNTNLSESESALYPHRRKNPLTDEWVLVSPQRMSRPWQGQVERADNESAVEHDPACYLCPGNARAGGSANPDYKGVYVFDNDFPALLGGNVRRPAATDQAWKTAQADSGVCRVICYSERHDLTLAELAEPAMLAVVDTWAEQLDELMSVQEITSVQIFENRGEVMGCSNPHPHGQIWASSVVPNEIIKEDRCQADFLTTRHECLLCAVARDELEAGERIICSNSDWVALVPYWAAWPFEALVLPRRHIATITELNLSERKSLVSIWQRLLRAYDALFQVRMPFSCGWHVKPEAPRIEESWHAHAHFYPPLLRSATVKKFMVGYEMLACPQRDLTAEAAAQRLREVVES